MIHLYRQLFMNCVVFERKLSDQPVIHSDGRADIHLHVVKSLSHHCKFLKHTQLA